MAIALVQSRSKVATGNNTTLAFLSNVTAGNLITVTQAHYSSPAQIVSTPIDTLGQTYVPMGAEVVTAGGVVKLRSYYVANCSGGADTVTFDIGSTTSGELAVSISEWSGVTLTSPLDAYNSKANSGSEGTTPNSNNVTPSVANCLMYGAMTIESNNVSITEDTAGGWTLLEEQVPVSTVPIGTQWKLQTSAVLEDADWVIGVSNNWACHIAAFKPAATLVTGVAAITDAPSTAAGVGTVSVTGAAARTQGADTAAATGTVPVVGAGAAVNASDTAAGAGTSAIAGSGAITQAPALAAGAGVVASVGVAGISQGPDTAASVGVVALAAAAAVQEAADVLTAAAKVALVGAAAMAESDDTSEGSGSTVGGIIGEGNIDDAADALVSAAAVATDAAAAIQELASTLAAAGAVDVAGQAAIVHVGDVVAAAAKAAITAAAAIQLAGDAATGTGTVVPTGFDRTGVSDITSAPDLLNAIAKAAIAATGMITESASILAATGSTLAVITGTGAITEAPDVTGDFAVESPDTAVGAGKVGVSGAGAVVQGPDVAAGAGAQQGANILEFPDVAAGAGKVAVAGTAQIFHFPDTAAATGTAPFEVLIQSAIVALNGVSGTTLAFPLNLTAGNLVVVSQVHFQGGGASIVSTPTDNLHNSLTKPYLPMFSEQRTADNLVALRSFYLPDCLGGPCTVNFDIAGTGTGELTVIVSEWNGRAQSSPLSVPVVATGPVSTAAPSSGDVGPIDDNSLLIAILNAGGVPITITPEAGWTTAQAYPGTSGTVTLSMIYKIQVGAPLVEDADWTLSAAKNCLAHVAAFKPLIVAAVAEEQLNSCMLQGHGR